MKPLRTLCLFLALSGIVILHGADDPAPFPDMAAQVGEQLDRHYYDHSRFQPSVMVERALRHLEGAEASIETTMAGETIVLNIAGTRSSVPAPKPQSMAEAMVLLDQVRKALAASDLAPQRRRDLDYALMNGALTSLDPHTMLLPPAPAKDFMEDIAGEFFGIGAFLNQEDGVIAIERVMPDFPAERAGVQDGDAILAVNGERMAGLSLDQAVRRIKGPKGTTVVLTLQRKTGGQVVDLPVVRDLVSVITVRSVRIGDVGYVRMDDFYATTAKDLFRELNSLKKQGPLRAVVLDLRQNGGGLLDQARLISNFFLSKGQEIVRTVAKGQDPDISWANGMPILDVPMVVLISPGSASAAEILSGALQINERAVVMGRTSFGKGSVQTVLPKLRDGAKLKITIQEYQLRDGVSIQDVGVTPDVMLMRHAIREDGNIDLVPYTSSREQDDEFALANSNAWQHDAVAMMGWLAKYVTKDDAKRSALSARDFQPDQEARLAIELVQAALDRPDFDRRAAEALANGRARLFLLDELKAPLAVRAEVEAVALGKALESAPRHAVWGGPGLADATTLTLASTGPTAVAAGSTVDLAFTVHNAGSATVGRLYGVVRTDRFSPLWEEEVVFGEVASGATAAAVLHFSAAERLYSGDERFHLDLYQGEDHRVLGSLPVVLHLTELPRPHLSLAWKVSDESGDGLLTAGERASLELSLVNDGQGPSKPVVLRVFKADDPHVNLGEQVRFNIDAVPAGGRAVPQTVKLTLDKEARRGAETVVFNGDSIKVEVAAEEKFPDDENSRYRANFFASLAIPVGKPLAGGDVVQPQVITTKLERLPGDKVRLALRASPRDQVRYLSIFQDEDKVGLEAGSALDAEGAYEATLTLKPGVNNVRVVVVSTQDVSEVLPLRLWGPEVIPLPAVPATHAALAAPKARAKTLEEPLP